MAITGIIVDILENECQVMIEMERTYIFIAIGCLVAGVKKLTMVKAIYKPLQKIHTGMRSL